MKSSYRVLIRKSSNYTFLIKISLTYFWFLSFLLSPLVEEYGYFLTNVLRGFALLYLLTLIDIFKRITAEYGVYALTGMKEISWFNSHCMGRNMYGSFNRASTLQYSYGWDNGSVVLFQCFTNTFYAFGKNIVESENVISENNKWQVVDSYWQVH